MTAVYLLGSERSGTNLLRRELTAHQKTYFGMSPAHLLKHLYFNEPFYGHLNDDQNFALYLQDAIDLCTIHFAPWDIKFNAHDIIKKYNAPRSSVYIADFLMREYANQKDYDSYFCKDNFIHEFALDIAHKLPESKFIYLYRDPRDVILSQTKRKNANNSIISFAKIWEYEQTRCIRAAYELESQGRCYSLSYEDFIQNTDIKTQEICAFLQTDYVTNTEKTPPDNITDTIHEWKNLDTPVMENNYQKFEEGLSKRQIQIIENICKKQMEYLSYTPSQPERKISRIDKLFDFISKKINVVMFHLIYRKHQKKSVANRSKLLKKFTLNYYNRG